MVFTNLPKQDECEFVGFPREDEFCLLTLAASGGDAVLEQAVVGTGKHVSATHV